MESIGLPTALFLSARFISVNSTDAGFSIFAAIVVFAFFRTVSDVSASRSGGGASGMGMIAGFALFSMRPVWSVGCPGAGSGAFAVVVNFTFAVAGPGLNDTGFNSTRGLTAVLWIHPFDVQRSCDACGGIRQHPIKVANRTPMISNLMHFLPLRQISARISWHAIKKPHALTAKLRAMLGHKVKMIEMAMEHHRAHGSPYWCGRIGL